MINDSLTTHLFPRSADTFFITFPFLAVRLLMRYYDGLSAAYVACVFLDVPEDSNGHMTTSILV